MQYKLKPGLMIYSRIVMLRLTIFIFFCFLMPQLSMAAQLSEPREAEIRNAVISYAKQKQTNFSSEVRLKRFTALGAPALPAGPLDYEVIAPQQWGGWGNTNVSVVVRQGDRVVGNINIRAEVEVLTDMVFTTRQIDLGTVFTATDLVTRKSDVGAVQGRYIASIDEVLGKRARMSLRANSVLRNDQLEKVPLIKSGQIVTILAETERIRITVTGKAKGSGAAGDTIMVQNLGSLKEIPARIISADTVQIVY
jgi:flagellar basal body P-ring formation protein FlgA